MIVFRNPGQFLLLPTVGFVKDGNVMCLTFAFLRFGVAFKLWEYVEQTPEE